MSTIADALKKSGAVEISPGEVWTVKDSVVIFPEERAGHQRSRHPKRFILVLSNDWICASLDCPCIAIAILSHLNTFRSTAETEIKQTDSNGLEHDSRVLLGHIQPILKTDLQERKGKLSLSEWEEVLRKLFWNFS
jgi:mRNA-degrading endonuclease toxin of MazEF toxin-antitoxin module